jgi:hypothetical protein
MFAAVAQSFVTLRRLEPVRAPPPESECVTAVEYFLGKEGELGIERGNIHSILSTEAVQSFVSLLRLGSVRAPPPESERVTAVEYFLGKEGELERDLQLVGISRQRLLTNTAGRAS